MCNSCDDDISSVFKIFVNIQTYICRVPQSSIFVFLLFFISHKNDITALFPDETAILRSYKGSYRSVDTNIKNHYKMLQIVTENSNKSVAVLFSHRREKAFAVDTIVKIKIYSKFIDWQSTEVATKILNFRVNLI